MAKKNIEGQLDMFELFDSVEELEEHIKGVPEMPEACGEEEKTGKQRGGVREMPEASGEEQEPEKQRGGVPEMPEASGEEQEPCGGVPEMPEACGEEEKQRGGVPEMPEACGEEQEPGTPVMQRSFRRGGETATVAYLDYHMVYVADWGREPVIRQFGQSKDAVDFYVERLEHFSADRQAAVQEQKEPLKRARVRKWTGDGEDETGDTES